MAMLLMTESAVNEFRDNTSTWQLGANTGLTVGMVTNRRILAGEVSNRNTARLREALAGTSRATYR